MKWILCAGLLLTASGCGLFGGDNHAPEFTTTPDTVATAGAEYEYAARATDSDDDDIDLQLIERPTWLSVEEGQGSELILRGTPSRLQAGPHPVELRAADGDESTSQAFTIRVGYDFAGTYQAISFTFFEPDCGATYDALFEGGFFTLTVGAFGSFEGRWEPGISGDPVIGSSFSGTYTVSDNVITLTGIDAGNAAAIWNGAQLRVEPPRLRQLNTTECGGRVTLEERGTD